MRCSPPFFLMPAISLCFLLLPQHALAQQQDRVPITFTPYTTITTGGGYTNCLWASVGSHADPVGKGRDADYTYNFTRSGSTPPAWTGAPEDLPGERITFFAGYYTRSVPTHLFSGCSFPSVTIPSDPYAYFAPLPNQPPTACFTYQASDDELLTVHFDASCSTDADGDVVGYSWNFGGAGTGGGGGAQTSFTYEKKGTYEVTLVVTDNDGDDGSASRAVEVEGPALRYVVTVKRLGDAASKTGQDEDPVFHVGDTVRVHVQVENTGDLPLRNVRVPDGFAGIEISPGGVLADLSAQGATLNTLVIDQLAPGASDELVFAHEAVQTVQQGGSVGVGTVEAEVEAQNTAERFVATAITCSTGNKRQRDPRQEDNEGCAGFSIEAAPLLVNATGDDPLGTDENGNPLDRCDTGGERVTMRDGSQRPECTLRAAVELANAGGLEGAPQINFDIPAEAPTIVLEDPIEVAVTLTIDGTSQPGATPGGTPAVALKGAAQASPGTTDGLVLQAPGVVVRGLAFTGFGTAVAVRAGEAVLEGNHVGNEERTDLTALNRVGVYVTDAPGVVVRDNLISGNGWGVRIEGRSEGTTVEDNRIGTRADGRGRSFNNTGVFILNAPANVIRNNLISGNRVTLDHGDDPGLTLETDFAGLRIEGAQATGNSVEGNRFGLAPGGSEINPNGVDIVLTRAPGNVIGGGGRNYIAGGVQIWYEEAEGNQITGNYLGVNGAGTAKIWGGFVTVKKKAGGTVISDNLLAGSIAVEGSNTLISNNTIRMQANGEDPLIDNTRFYNGSGITVEGTGTRITGNRIGHGSLGIRLESKGEGRRADHTLIEGNEIFNNRNGGIFIEEDRAHDAPFDSGYGARFNTIRANAIYNNHGRGIKTAGPLLSNDLFDLDAGANDRQNHPEFLFAELKGGVLRAEGTLRTPPGSGQVYVVDFYANRYCNLSHENAVETDPYGEGERYLGSVEATSSARGSASFSWAITPWPSGHFVLTATATNPDGSTSEFSRCQYVSSRVAQADFDPQATGLVLDEAGVQVTVTGRASAKTRETATLYASRYESQPERNVFAGSATGSDGSEILPEHVRFRYYHLTAAGLLDGNATRVAYDLCLDATGQTSEGSFDRLLLLQRNAETDDVWVPHDTRIEQKGGARYACAKGLTAFGEFGFGVGGTTALAAPLLVAPEDNAEDVSEAPMLSWQAAGGAASYEVQVARSAAFATPVFEAAVGASLSVQAGTEGPGLVHYWRVRGVDAGGVAGPWSLPRSFRTGGMPVGSEGAEEPPAQFALEAAYPNPFNPRATIGFSLPQSAEVRLAVYDVLGREVAVLVEGVRPAGRHEAVFEASGLPTGVYLYRLAAGRLSETRRMLLVK